MKHSEPITSQIALLLSTVSLGMSFLLPTVLDGFSAQADTLKTLPLKDIAVMQSAPAKQPVTKDKNIKSAFGYALRPVTSFADDSTPAFQTESLWNNNRITTSQADRHLSDCFDNHAEKTEYCESVSGLQDFIKQNRDKDLPAKIRLVQNTVNHHIAYTSDTNLEKQNWSQDYIKENQERFDLYEKFGKIDFFQTYFESHVLKTGDCDDYAIMKYDLLRLLGVPEEKMMLVLGFHREVQNVDEYGKPRFKENSNRFVIEGENYGAHIILIVDNGAGKKLVLDNTGNDALYLEEGYKFLPTYAMNGQNKWIAYNTDKNNNLNIIRRDILETQPFLKASSGP